MYCNICKKQRKFKKTEMSCNLKKMLSKSGHEYEKIFKDEVMV